MNRKQVYMHRNFIIKVSLVSVDINSSTKTNGKVEPVWRTIRKYRLKEIMLRSIWFAINKYLGFAINCWNNRCMKLMFRIKLRAGLRIPWSGKKKTKQKNKCHNSLAINTRKQPVWFTNFRCLWIFMLMSRLSDLQFPYV